MPRILIVEDEIEIVDSMKKLLKPRGYEISVAHLGRDTLRMLHEEEVDMVIIDLNLPDMNGYDLCATIRHDQRLKNLPLIISTGMADETTRQLSEKFDSSWLQCWAVADSIRHGILKQ